MTRKEKLKELANMFQYWLDFNEQNFGYYPSDDVNVIPPSYPSRKVVKEWIKILENK